MSEGISFSDAERKVLRERYKKLTDNEFEAFLCAARRYQLNPMANQIYARLTEGNDRNPRNVAYAAQIDGYRLIADRTSKYAGNDDPVYDDEKNPKKASVTVYKMVGGNRCPFTATARWDQYFPGPRLGFMWTKMPHLMLGKCAEGLALRKAFPAELAGLYAVEELDQLGGDDKEPTKTQSKPVAESSAGFGIDMKASASVQIANVTVPGLLLALLATWEVTYPVASRPDWWEKVHKAAVDKYSKMGWDDGELVDRLNAIQGEIDKTKVAAPAL